MQEPNTTMGKSGVTKESSGSSPPRAKRDSKGSQGKPAKKPAPPPVQSKTVKERDCRQKARAVLESESKVIVLQERPRHHIRHIKLEVSKMLIALVAIYTPVFISHWTRFSRVTQMSHADTIPLVAARLATTYISGWIYDLYSCLRKATESKDPTAFRAYFLEEVSSMSDYYDEYLVTLNAMIRPTTILGTLEETMYVPYITDNAMVNPNDPFNIGAGYNLDFGEFQAIIAIMIESKEFRTSKLKFGSTEGRPVWLLDWWSDKLHRNIRAHTWFPFEGNFTLDDVSVAYIMGGPMTSVMAPCDRDLQQRAPSAYVDGTNPDFSEYVRKKKRQFYGAVEERDIIVDLRRTVIDPVDTGAYDPAVPKYAIESDTESVVSMKGGTSKRTRSTSSSNKKIKRGEGTNEHVGNRYWIVIEDYCYYSQVIRAVDTNSRYRALSQFVYTKGN
uniref:Coat protein n=1 Tax=Ribbonwort deltapartitivirus TaxID=2933098 RepID=A0A9C7GX33_9VIRU|nr:putative coat protein [Ribbonwort deltapartitivirus]CAI5383984.1 putative coat protein [Ribbonwort deltapartitivirus]